MVKVYNAASNMIHIPKKNEYSPLSTSKLNVELNRRKLAVNTEGVSHDMQKEKEHIEKEDERMKFFEDIVEESVLFGVCKEEPVKNRCFSHYPTMTFLLNNGAVIHVDLLSGSLRETCCRGVRGGWRISSDKEKIKRDYL